VRGAGGGEAEVTSEVLHKTQAAQGEERGEERREECVKRRERSERRERGEEHLSTRL
jgi:hypothetical protein